MSAALPMIATTGKVLGTATAVAGQEFQGQTNAAVANYNADIADQNAASVTAQGEEQARRALINSRKMNGNAIASYSASGVSNDGSAQWVLRESAAQGELNALTIESNAKMKATAFKNEAALDRYRAGNDITAGHLGAAAALFNGVSNMTSGTMGGTAGDAEE